MRVLGLEHGERRPKELRGHRPAAVPRSLARRAAQSSPGFSPRNDPADAAAGVCCMAEESAAGLEAWGVGPVSVVSPLGIVSRGNAFRGCVLFGHLTFLRESSARVLRDVDRNGRASTLACVNGTPRFLDTAGRRLPRLVRSFPARLQGSSRCRATATRRDLGPGESHEGSIR
jgi:hypothetical protein